MFEKNSKSVEIRGISESKNDCRDKFEILNNLSILERIKSPDKSIEYGLQALELASEINDKKSEIKALSNIARTYAETLKYEEAIEFFQKALRIGTEINDDENNAETLNSLGKIYTSQNKLQNSLECYVSALKIKEKQKDVIGISYFITRVGVINIQLGNYQEALQLFLKSLAIEENLGKDESVAICLNNIGILFKSLGDNHKSLENHYKALSIFQKIGNQKGESYSYNNIGNNYKKLCQYEKALEYYFQSLQINQLISDKNGVANSFNNIGNCYMKMNQFDTSLEYLKKGLTIRKEMSDQRGIAVLTLNIANLHFLLNNNALALQEAYNAIKIAKKIEIKPLMKDSYELLAQIYSKVDDYQKAFHFSELLADIKASMYSEESSKKIAEMQTKYEIHKKEKEAEIYKLKNVELAGANKKIKEQSEQLQLITKILRHDLKNNLSVILSAIKLFSHNQDNSYIEEAIGKIKKSNELIDKMREMEVLMKSNLNLKPFSLEKVVQEVLKNFQANEIQFSNLSGQVLADDTIISVFDNIIANAFIHSKTDKVSIKMIENHNEIIVEIADFGVGIPNSIKEKIFDESFHYGNTGNTGLGLYIVKKAVESFGGKIYVYDNKPSGSIFALKFKKAEFL